MNLGKKLLNVMTLDIRSLRKFYFFPNILRKYTNKSVNVSSSVNLRGP